MHAVRQSAITLILAVTCATFGAGPSCADPATSLIDSPVWKVTCLPDLRLCLATSETMVCFLDTDNKPHLVFKGPQPERVSVLSGRFARDLPDVTDRALTESEVNLLNKNGAKVILEWHDQTPMFLPSEGIEIAIAQLRLLLSAPFTATQSTSASPELQRYLDAQNSFEDPKPVFLPATKPQVQFALRAQDGNVLPVISGAGDIGR